MTDQQLVKLLRDVSAVTIPSGEKVNLASGTEVMITQSLGGTFTVTTNHGAMVRISGQDADALGKQVPVESKTTNDDQAKPVAEQVWDQLKTCYDPEIAVNIVDLGLVYDCKVTPTDQNKHNVAIKMTLTAPGCGMGASIAADAKGKIEQLAGINDVQVDLVWEPPWEPSKMSEEAKLKLGIT